jgi:hypothetical protein
MNPITLTLTGAETQALYGLLDAVLRQSGMTALDTVLHFREKLKAAAAASAEARAETGPHGEP